LISPGLPCLPRGVIVKESNDSIPVSRSGHDIIVDHRVGVPSHRITCGLQRLPLRDLAIDTPDFRNLLILGRCRELINNEEDRKNHTEKRLFIETLICSDVCRKPEANPGNSQWRFSGHKLQKKGCRAGKIGLNFFCRWYNFCGTQQEKRVCPAE